MTDLTGMSTIAVSTGYVFQKDDSDYNICRRVSLYQLVCLSM